jgi:hypothetical protein
MFGEAVIKDATHIVIQANVSVRKRLARNIRTFKWSMRGEVEGGWKDFKSFFFNFMICKNKVKRKS